MEKSVENLLERVRAGDREALQEVIDRYEPLLRRRIRGKLRQVTRSVFATDDALQEARIRADQAFRRGTLTIDDTAQLRAWLRVTAERVALNANRGAERSGRLTAEVTRRARVARDPERSPAEKAEQVDAVLRRVPEPERGMLVDMVLREIPHRIAAWRRGLTAAAMRRRLRRLRADGLLSGRPDTPPPRGPGNRLDLGECVKAA